MIEEDEATGRVAAVYVAALERAPFVPSLLKSVAVCPGYLVLAWEQAAPVLDGPELPERAGRLAARVAHSATPPSDPRDRELLGAFVEPLGRMLLLSCGLLIALDGGLPARPSATGARPSPTHAQLPRPVPSVGDLAAHSAVFGRLCAALETPIVNSVWRRAAAEGRLEELWEELEPQVTRTRTSADALEEAAIAAAAELPWQAVASADALRTAGIADAEPGIRSILRSYATTLSRVLTLLACCSPAGEDG